MKTKICTKCGEEKKLSEFAKDKRATNGVLSACKECKNKEAKEHRLKFPWRHILKDIKKRCDNPKNNRYYCYGGRGIECRITEEELKELWFRDKARLLDRPSIDREDNDGHYEYSNCKFIEFRINSGKDKRKPILQFDLNRIFMKEWKSITDACLVLNLKNSNLSLCLTGQNKTAGGFIWRYKDV